MVQTLTKVSSLRQAHIGLLGLILIGFAIRMAAIDFQSLWRDEVDAAGFGDPALRVGDMLAAGNFGEIGQTLTRPGFNGPLYFIALQQWRQLAGSSAFALRFPSALLGALAIPLVYTLARRFFPASRGALMAAWLTTISPYFVWYAQEAKMYAEITALAALAVYALRRAVESGPGQPAWHWWLVVILATTLGMYSHIFVAFLIGVEVALFLLWWPRARRHWRGGAIALAALTLPYLPLAPWQVQQALTPGETGFGFYSLDAILRVMINAFAHGVLPFDYSLSVISVRWAPETFRPELSPAYWGMWLLAALAILGIFSWKGPADRAHRIGLAAWVFLPAAAIALVSLNRPLFTDRYLIWIGPAVYLLAALGLRELWDWRRAAGGAALALLSVVMLVGVAVQSTTPFKADFRSAARYLEARYQGEPIVFQIPYGVYTFDYYFEPPFPAIDGPYTNYRNPDGAYQLAESAFDAEIAAKLAGRDAVWLVATEVEMWDDRFVLQKWLEQHGRPVERMDFTRVTVVKYALNAATNVPNLPGRCPGWPGLLPTFSRGTCIIS